MQGQNRAANTGFILCYALCCYTYAVAASSLVEKLLEGASLPELAVVEWAKAEGATINAVIGRNRHGVRGLFAARPIRKGEVILDIPDHLVLSVKNAGAAEAAPVLLKELHTPCSRLKPYMDALPGPSEVLTGYNWPEQYIPFLASKVNEDHIRNSFHRHVRDVLAGRHDQEMEMTIPEAVGRLNVTFEYYQYITSLLTTRTFSVRKAALSMVPVADMANHDVREINHLDNTDHEQPGFRILAGKDLEEGEEVTITYGPMRNDELLLYYGFVDEITQPPQLCLVDHPKYELYKSDSSQLGTEPFTGTHEEMQSEVTRLRAILAEIHETIAALGPVPDTLPYAAALVRRFRELRIAALEAEVARLEGLMEAGLAEGTVMHNSEQEQGTGNTAANGGSRGRDDL